jgi:hypothetical protein
MGRAFAAATLLCTHKADAFIQRFARAKQSSLKYLRERDLPPKWKSVSVCSILRVDSRMENQEKHSIIHQKQLVPSIGIA